MSYALAILLACLTLLCISVHDRLARRRIETQREITEANTEAVERIAVRSFQRAQELASHQAKVFVRAHRASAEAWRGIYGDDEPWK